MLECDAPVAALRSFSVEASSDPNRADPKVGYALAAGMIGNYSTGIWAMHRAFELDAKGLDYMHLEPASRDVALELVQDYERLRYNSPESEDLRFMVAALRFFLDDPAGARDALGETPPGGWQRVSTIRLDRMVDDRLGSAIAKDAMAKSGSPPLAAAPAGPTPPPERSAERDSEKTLDGAPGAPATSETTQADAGAQTRPEPVDYDEVRQGLLDASKALNEFADKLINSIERTKPTSTASRQPPG